VLKGNVHRLPSICQEGGQGLPNAADEMQVVEEKTVVGGWLWQTPVSTSGPSAGLASVRAGSKSTPSRASTHEIATYKCCELARDCNIPPHSSFRLPMLIGVRISFEYSLNISFPIPRFPKARASSKGIIGSDLSSFVVSPSFVSVLMSVQDVEHCLTRALWIAIV